MRRSHLEEHAVSRIGWMRAAVLGANDGVVSTASLIMGVAAAGSGKPAIITAGLAGLVAGALSMAAGEYVSVSSQLDSENADIAKERTELEASPEAEQRELSQIYVERGLTRALADQVAEQLTQADALGAHTRDELGLSELTSARPIQAALTSAAMFTAGAAAPLVAVLIAPHAWIMGAVAVTALIFLAVLGALGAGTGGAPPLRPVVRTVFWGAIAFAVTAGIGGLFGVVA
jgi:VIT1/CCC1 family predicted Fe2+/Mn2+ transporter